MKKINWIRNIITFLFIAFLIFLIIICFRIYHKLGVDPESWVDHLRPYGVYSFFALLLLQLFQVFIAIIPGELTEIAAGLLFDHFVATLVCYIGVFLASALIFFIMRKLGKRYSRIFISEEKISSLRFINTKDKLKRTAFILFLIPGTPKDLLTYFFALTPIRFSDFIAITIIARFPSVISSVVGGRYIGNEEYLKAVVLFATTALASIIGLAVYNNIKKRMEKKKLMNK